MKFYWDKIINNNEAFHIACAYKNSHPPHEMHTHNFFEIFFVSKGKMIHKINGNEEEMQAGDLCIIEPDDLHSLTGASDDYIFYNLAFPSKTMEYILKRYCGGFIKQKRHKLKGKKRKDFTKKITGMGLLPKETLFIEKFLLDFFVTINNELPKNKNEKIPDWLQEACLDFKKPENLCGGLKRFIALSCKCQEHLSREIKKHYKLTPSQFVKQTQINYAANELLMTNKEIINISLDSGFESLNYFYQCFKDYHSISPRKYRIKNKKIL